MSVNDPTLDELEIPLPTIHNFKNLTGMTFGQLTVLAFAGNRGDKAVWRCRCFCGKEIVAYACNLSSGKSKTCGCVRDKATGDRSRKHGLSRSSEHNAWQHMRRRCFNKRDKSYRNYGGRGITVCDEWRDSFEAFYRDMGPRPSAQHSIERINVNGDYEPNNCRWATRKEQSRNTRRNFYVTFQGITATLAEHCERLGLRYGAIALRLRRYGWSIEDAFLTPLRKQKSG